MTSDWFEDITGFRELDYPSTQRRLVVDDGAIVSTATGRRCGFGTLALTPLRELRDRVTVPDAERTTVECIAADVGELHAREQFAGAMFQVASQFNLLEMVSQHVTPEDGVTRYATDHTQGPTCAIAAGAATIYRNYLVPEDGQFGQTRDRQLDGLAGIGDILAGRLGRPQHELWTMSNGYALATRDGLAAINELLAGDQTLHDELRGALAIGLHRNVEVTAAKQQSRQTVSQAFCSALPVAYSDIPPPQWEAFARLILEAAYEATMLATVESAANGGSRTVLLTRLGGGVFGNDDAWIDDAIVRSLRIVEHAGLDVRLVSHERVHPSMQSIADTWQLE